MKTSSCKAKGRNLQNEVARLLREKYINKLAPPALIYLYSTRVQEAKEHVKPAIMGESGVDIKLTPTAKRVIPFDIECKNVEKLNIWSALAQAEANNKEGRVPLLIFKRNHSKVYAVLEFEELLKLLP